MTKALLIYESSDKFAPKDKLSLLYNEVILTYLPGKSIFFTFFNYDTATFKLFQLFKSDISNELQKMIE